MPIEQKGYFHIHKLIQHTVYVVIVSNYAFLPLLVNKIVRNDF